MSRYEVWNLAEGEFTDRYLSRNEPVIVRGALSKEWRLPPPWDLSSLSARFADRIVPLFDTLFTMQRLARFGDYVSEIMRTGYQGGDVPYMRWFVRQSDEQVVCADDAFAELAGDWDAPSWLPSTGYVFPGVKGIADPVRDPFPAKGIFICGTGGRTRLHVDPWASDACLCQITGKKRFLMYPPSAEKFLSSAGAAVDLAHPDAERFPEWETVAPSINSILYPGDAIFVPAGWFHTAIALSNSVSITWNFVHEVNVERFHKYLAACVSPDPTIRHFGSTLSLE